MDAPLIRDEQSVRFPKKKKKEGERNAEKRKGRSPVTASTKERIFILREGEGRKSAAKGDERGESSLP